MRLPVAPKDVERECVLPFWYGAPYLGNGKGTYGPAFQQVVPKPDDLLAGAQCRAPSVELTLEQLARGSLVDQAVRAARLTGARPPRPAL